MLEFFLEHWIYFVYGFNVIVLFCLSIVYLVKNRKLKLLDIAEKAVEQAEKLGGTAEQKKIYATAIIKSEMRVNSNVVSNVIEKLIDFSKQVNSNKSIQEVLCDEFKNTNK